ncbi:hypothetical protein D3C85_1487160 [compost metagenome]
MLLGAGLWGLFAAPAKTTLREIHCLRGTPKRWGLFGENDQEHINNISLGIIDLIYPRHWQPWIAQDLGQKTDIDIYLDRHVVRQGRLMKSKTSRSSTGFAVPLSPVALRWCWRC